MKNKICFLLVPIVALFFFIPLNKTLATSGACSYHGGVDCSAGASSDGNAICEDGTESSVAYSAMAECINTSVTSNECSPLYASEEYNLYTRSSPAQQQAIKETVQSYIPVLNSSISAVNDSLDTDIQNITNADEPIISQYQNEKAQAVASAEATYAAANPNGFGSDGSQFIDSVGSQYDTSIQEETQSENDTITELKQKANDSVSNYSSCIDSLNTLTAQLDSVVNAPVATPTVTASKSPVQSSVKVTTSITTPSVLPTTTNTTSENSSSTVQSMVAVSTPQVQTTILSRIMGFFKKLF